MTNEGHYSSQFRSLSEGTSMLPLGFTACFQLIWGLGYELLRSLRFQLGVYCVFPSFFFSIIHQEDCNWWEKGREVGEGGARRCQRPACSLRERKAKAPSSAILSESSSFLFYVTFHTSTAPLLQNTHTHHTLNYPDHSVSLIHVFLWICR